jgi:hypothetical protein
VLASKVSEEQFPLGVLGLLARDASSLPSFHACAREFRETLGTLRQSEQLPKVRLEFPKSGLPRARSQERALHDGTSAETPSVIELISTFVQFYVYGTGNFCFGGEPSVRPASEDCY